LYYSPNYKSTLWTLLLLADIKAPIDLPQIKPSIRLITERFYDPDKISPGGHCERFLRSNLSKLEIATPQEEQLRFAMTIIRYGCPNSCSKASPIS